MKPGIIYGICHIPTNRWYIGQTVRGLKCRWKEHIAASEYENLHLYQAMRKYGLDQFMVVVLESDIPDNLLDERECFYIQKYDSFNSGFNNTLGGQGIHGYRHNLETKRRIGAAMKVAALRYNTPERTEKIRKALKGKPLTAEHLEHIRQYALTHKRYGLDKGKKAAKSDKTRKKSDKDMENYGKIVVADDSETEQKYKSEYRGKVQDKNVEIKLEPMFALTYYEKVSEITRNLKYNKFIDDLSNSGAVPKRLLITNMETPLTEKQIKTHFASIDERTTDIVKHPKNAAKRFARSIDY
jgi:group I intron endonuclease